ncbi:MAG: CdaR family protein [Saprospiraceae bacterium]|nr:CdaR family protein [Saprospiraceae bacterium]
MPFTEKRAEVIREIRQFFLEKDRGILVICMGISLFFWLLVKLSETYTTEKRLRFDFTHPVSKTVYPLPPEDLKVEIQGKGWELMVESFKGGSYLIEYDLREEVYLEVNPTFLRNQLKGLLSSNTININSFNSDGFVLFLENRVKKKVQVLLRDHLTFAPEFHLQGFKEVTPDSVWVSGPESKLDELNVVETAWIPEEELKSSKTYVVALQLPEPEFKVDPPQVEVYVPVEQYTEKQFFVPIRVKNPPRDSMQIFPKKILVTCVIGLSQYDQVSEKDFKLEVDIAKAALSGSKTTVPIQLTQYPIFARDVNFSPKSVEFFLIAQ